MKIFSLYSNMNQLLDEIDSKHNFLYNYIKNNINLINNYENSYNKIINKLNIYYNKLPKELIDLNKTLIKNKIFIKNKFQLKLTNIVILYKIKLYIKKNLFKKYNILKKHYIDFYKTFLYKKNINNLLLIFIKKNNNLNKISNISKKNLYFLLKQKLMFNGIYISKYYNDNQFILIYHYLFKITNNDIELIKINNDFLKLSNLFNYFFNILSYKDKYNQHKKYIIKSLNNFYKYCNYFLDDNELIKIISKDFDFIIKLKEIIKLIYNKNINKFKKNDDLYKILNFKFKLI